MEMMVDTLDVDLEEEEAAYRWRPPGHLEQLAADPAGWAEESPAAHGQFDDAPDEHAAGGAGDGGDAWAPWGGNHDAGARGAPSDDTGTSPQLFGASAKRKQSDAWSAEPSPPATARRRTLEDDDERFGGTQYAAAGAGMGDADGRFFARSTYDEVDEGEDEQEYGSEHADADEDADDMDDVEDVERAMPGEGEPEGCATGARVQTAFWGAEAQRILRDASELGGEELADTVAAVEVLSTDESGVQCIAHHPHGVRLLQALMIALQVTGTSALSSAIAARACAERASAERGVCSEPSPPPPRRSCCRGGGGGTRIGEDEGGDAAGAISVAPAGAAGEEGEDRNEDLQPQKQERRSDDIGTAANSAGAAREGDPTADETAESRQRRTTCCTALNAICNISQCAAGRKWLASHVQECEALVSSLSALLHDELPGWEVTDLAAASALSISNLLCSKTLSAKLVGAELASVASWMECCKMSAYSVTSAETQCTTTVAQGAGTMVRGLTRQLSHFPSHAAVSSATAIGNLARREGGLDLLLAGSGSEVVVMLEDLADMVDDAHEDARAEALTALCNLLEDSRALQLLVRSSNAMDDIISGVAFCLQPYRVREAFDNGDMEAVTDAAALIARVLSHVRGEAAVLEHEEGPSVAAGLAALAHRCVDQEASLLAMEALRAMLDSAAMRPVLVSSIPAGALLFRLASWLAHGFDGQGAKWDDAHEAGDKSDAGKDVLARSAADKVVEQVMLRVLDGLGRGEDGAVWEHGDSKRVVLAVTQLVHDAAQREQQQRDHIAQARQEALKFGAKFRATAAATGAAAAREAALLSVAAKAAETLGRFAMTAQGARAICVQGDVVCVFRSLGVLAKAGRATWHGCKLALHMLLSHEVVCTELARRVLVPPPPLAPPREYSKEEGLEVLDHIMTSLVHSLGQHSSRLRTRSSGHREGRKGGEPGEEEDEEEDEDEDEEDEGVNVDDCVGAVAGLASSEALLAHVEKDSRLPLLVLRLVSLLTGAAEAHMDAANAIRGFITNSASACRAVESIIIHLACRMAGRSDPVEAAACIAGDDREDEADLCREERRRLAAAALEKGLQAWQSASEADCARALGLLLHAVPSILRHMGHVLVSRCMENGTGSAGQGRAHNGGTRGTGKVCLAAAALEVLMRLPVSVGGTGGAVTSLEVRVRICIMFCPFTHTHTHKACHTHARARAHTHTQTRRVFCSARCLCHACAAMCVPGDLF